MTYQEIVDKLSEFEDRTDHNLGDAFFLFGTHLEIYYDGSGFVNVKLHRKDREGLQLPMSSITGEVEKRYPFSNEEELIAILNKPLRTNND